MNTETPVTELERRTGLLRSNRDFRWYWSGQTVSFVGTHVTATALPLVAALTLGAGPGGISLVATASFLPNLVLPLLVGHWLEGRRKRSVLISVDVLRAVALLTIPAAFALDLLSLPLLAVVAMVVGTGSVFFEIGGFSYLPTVVPRERLGEANRAMQGSSTIAQVAGPGLAGVLVQALGAPIALVVDALSYVASVVGISGARDPEAVVDAPPGGRIRDGITLIIRHPLLRPLTVHAAMFNAAAQVFMVNLVVWMVQVHDVSPGLYGGALSAAGIGAFLGTMVALRLAERLGFGRAFVASVSVSCGVPLLTALMPWSGSTLGYGLAVLQVVACVGLGSANVLSTSLRQTVIPASALARTNGAYRNINFGAIPLGAALAGILGEALGSRAGVALGTVGMAVSALPMLAPAVRRLRSLEDVDQELTPAGDGPG